MAQGTIHDLAYRRYEGVRASPATRPWVIVRYALRTQLRQTVVKVFLAMGLLSLAGHAVGLFAVSALERAGEAQAPGQVADELQKLALQQLGGWAFSAQALPIFLLMITCGAPAIANDLNAGAFQFYFARPVSVGQYLVGRVLAAAGWGGVLAVSTLGALAAEEVALGISVTRVVPVVARSLAVLLVQLVVLASVALGLSSLTRRRALAQTLFAALVVASGLVTGGVSLATHKPWVRALGVTGAPSVLREQLMGTVTYTGWTVAVPAAACVAWAGLFLGMAWWRLARAEVVRG